MRPSKAPRVFTVTLNTVAIIPMEGLRKFILAKTEGSNEILTSITALNVLLRHEPTLRCPSNARSFFTDQERIEVGGAVELWRGWFQSIVRRRSPVAAEARSARRWAA